MDAFTFLKNDHKTVAGLVEIKVLQENVRHHVEEEETKMFKLAREVLSKEEINDLGDRLHAEKNKFKAAAASA